MNIVFDIGGVLLDFHWDRLMKSLFDEETAKTVTEATWHNPGWNEFDLGNISDEEVLKLFIKNAPDYEMQIRRTFARLGDAFEKKEDSIPLIKRLKADGHKVYYLSNYFEYLMHIAPEPIDFIPYTDGGIFSCYVHAVKPQPEIYNALCRKYNLRNEECVFIDDRKVNVEGAEKTGMTGIHYTGQSAEELYRQINVIASAKGS